MSKGKANRNVPNYNKFFEKEAERRQEIQAHADRLMKERVKINVDSYVDSLPEALQSADYKTFSPSLKDKVQRMGFTGSKNKSFIFVSSSSNYGMYVAAGVAKRFIEAGVILPSEIKTTTLIEGYDNINGMFQSRDWKEYFFDTNAKLLIVDGVSASMARLRHKDEEKFWREFTERARAYGKIVFLIYNQDNTDISNPTNEKIIVPTLSSVENLNKNIILTSKMLLINEEEEESIDNEQRKSRANLQR